MSISVSVLCCPRYVYLCLCALLLDVVVLHSLCFAFTLAGIEAPLHLVYSTFRLSVCHNREASGPPLEAPRPAYGSAGPSRPLQPSDLGPQLSSP